jgi:signal transduction histidine kinase
VPTENLTPEGKRPRGQASIWAAVFIVTTVVLAIAAAERIAERKHLEERFSSTAQLSVAKMAADFDRHLDQLAGDAALLAELLWQTGKEPRCPPALRDKVLDDSVRVLSSAIHHCQGVAFSQNGTDFDLALEPSEDARLAPWLKEQGRQAFRSSFREPHLTGPLPAPPGERPFFVQVQHLPFGVVAAAIDARRLFETLQHGRPPDARFLVIDAQDTLWAGCGSFATCQAIPRQEWTRNPELLAFMNGRLTAEPVADIPTGLRRIISLPAAAELAVHWHSLDTGGAPITLGLVTSLSELQVHRRAERWRLLATSSALLFSTGIVGFFLWRQRQKEAALHASLRHAEALNRLEHQLVRAEKLATVGVLTAGLAHEVGTPLAIIRGRAELLDEKNHLPETKTILEQSDRIASTLRQVLDFSREQPVVVQPTDVAAVFTAIVGLLDFRLRAKRLRCDSDTGDEACRVAADPDQLQQVLVNLVMNACDACAPGGRIVLRARPAEDPPGFVRIEVVDNGCGIPAEKQEAVFDPFYTTKPKGEGTGLGLPVAASIVRNHQGQISIASEAGRGTTVTVLWPGPQGAGA